MDTFTIPTTHDPAVNRARCVLYRLSALALADPRTGSWARLIEPATRLLADQALAVLRDEAQAVAAPLARGEKKLDEIEIARLFDALPDSEEALNALYEASFGLLVSSTAPPYESEYVDGKLSFQRAQLLADVAGYYRAFGLETSTSHPERPDHVALELEFMANLLDLEQQAATSDLPEASERRGICRDAQRQFVTDHLAWWLPAFAALLRREVVQGFYAEVTALLAALIAAERALLSVPPPHVAPQPTRIDHPEECDGCALSGINSEL